MSNQYYDGGYKRGGGGGGKSSGGAGDAAKIFVGGLNRETTDDEMKTYFSSFGAVTEAVVKKDPNTGGSRGFGFVTFADASSVDLVVAERAHVLQGKTIDPKRAKARTGMEGVTKVFVGGLDPNLPESDIRDYFQRFGKIDTLELPFDREKNMRRGFCFVSFESSDAVDTLCTSAKHTIGGREVDVKKATPKGEQREQNGGSRGGRGGGRGGGHAGADPYAAGGWGAQPGYPAAPAAYGAAYDYSAYYAQQPQYGGYGQQPAAAGYPDPYSQAYAATGAYDYSAWYGAAPTAGAGAPPANGSSGGPYGRSQRGGGSENRYTPY